MLTACSQTSPEVKSRNIRLFIQITRSTLAFSFLSITFYATEGLTTRPAPTMASSPIYTPREIMAPAPVEHPRRSITDAQGLPIICFNPNRWSPLRETVRGTIFLSLANHGRPKLDGCLRYWSVQYESYGRLFTSRNGESDPLPCTAARVRMIEELCEGERLS